MHFSGNQPKTALYYAFWGATPNLELHRIVYNGADLAGYPRPAGATPVRASLVPAFNACTAGNRGHGTPLAHPSCDPPARSSPNITIGTPDVTGSNSQSTGFVRLSVVPGNPGTTPDEADVKIRVQISDVRRSTTGFPDYTGQLQLRLPLRLTDRDNGGPAGFPHGTVEDRNFEAAVACTATGSTSVGSTCSLNSTADAILPGVVAEGKRAVWQLGQVQLLDGGTDGVASTTPNSPFAAQGIAVP
jgi:hypothetical protein